MSKVRYFFAVALAIAALVAAMVLLSEWDFFTRLLLGYMMASTVGEFIFWDYSLSTRVLKLVLRVFAIIFLFWIGWFASGIVGIIIGLVLASPLWAAMGAVLTFAFSAFGMLSLFLFPVHLVSYAFILE